MRNKKNAFTVTVPKSVPDYIVGGEKPTVDAAVASKMLDAITAQSKAADDANKTLATLVYELDATLAWKNFPRYASIEGKKRGFYVAVFDAAFGGQAANESMDQYIERVMLSKSRISAMRKSGYLLSYLNKQDWDFKAAPRYDFMECIAQLVGHPVMKGDAMLTASTCAGLIQSYINDAEYRKIEVMRQAVRNIIDPSNELETGDEMMTVVMTIKVPKGTSPDKIKSAKKAGLAAARKALKG